MATLHVRLSVALRHFTLDVGLSVGEKPLALVGPSGAGKTTVLRAVAGLLRPAAGRVTLGDAVWFDAESGVALPPERRSVGFVFQEYALFPHLDVLANVAFGGGDRAPAVLERLGIAHLAAARPTALSGGERQRVAVARALARDPDVLLLDEPLAALDAHTRSRVRTEMSDLLESLGRPALIVTHDFEDAAALAGRIAVVVEGRVRQVGSPEELLERPGDPFVAALTGGNLLIGDAEPAGDGTSRVRVGGGELRVAGEHRGRVGVTAHPWQIGLAPGGGSGPPSGVRGRVSGMVAAGDRVRLSVGAVSVEAPASEVAGLGLVPGSEAWALIDPETSRVIQAPAA